MAQCQGKTKKGAQCKRDAMDGSSFCNIHMDQEVRERSDVFCQEWDRETLKWIAIGVGVAGLMFLLRGKR